MKVLMTADPVGGVWTYALELARGLAERDIAVSLAVEGAALTAAQRDELNEARFEGWWSSERKLEWMPDPWDDVDANTAWLQELAQEIAPDVVHLNSFSHAAARWPAPVLLGAHSCVLSWWRAVKGEAAPSGWGAYARRVRSGLQGASLVVAPTAAFLRQLAAIYGFDTPSVVVPNGLNAASPRSEKRAFVLCVGRVWDEAKNISLVEAVAPDLSWPVVVVGEGRGAGSPNVRRAGKVSRAEVRRWMTDAAIFCGPARYEPFGLAALEAAAHGCALVLGDIPTLREVWRDAAFFVDPDDGEGLRRICSLLIEDRTLRDDLASRARRRAAAFGGARMTDAYLGLYQSARRLDAPEVVATR